MQNIKPLALAAAGAIAATLAAAPAASADVIAGFNFTGADPALQIANGNRIAPSTTAPGATVTNGFGGGTFNPVGTVANRRVLQVASVDVLATNGAARVTTFAGDDSALRNDLVAFGVYEQSQDDGGATVTGLNSLQGVLDDDKAFLSFTVAPAAGQQLNLNGGTLGFDYFVGASNQARNIGVFTSVDGFSTAGNAVSTFTNLPNGTVDPGTAIDGDGTFSGVLSRSATFSGSQFDGLTGPVEVRLYFYGAQFNLAGGNRFSTLDNVVLNGTVAPAAVVPEPTSVALLGAGGLMVLGRRRRLA